jgi:hypothetical protein
MAGGGSAGRTVEIGHIPKAGATILRRLRINQEKASTPRTVLNMGEAHDKWRV